MTTSTNDNQDLSKAGGAFADGLTLVRIILAPIIAFVIIKAWSGHPDDPMGFVSLNIKLVILATFLFAIAAITDILDDFVGGSAKSATRAYGWFDDIADSILIAVTLVALIWVTNQAGLIGWTFAVPAIVFIMRDVIVGILKGYEISKFGFLESKLGDLKSALAMLATCTLVASPWLSNIVDGLRVGKSAESAMEVYNSASTWVWNFGIIVLWIAAILAVITGVRLLKTDYDKLEQTKDEEQASKS